MSGFSTARPVTDVEGPGSFTEADLKRVLAGDGTCGDTPRGDLTTEGGGTFVDRGGWISRPANIDTGFTPADFNPDDIVDPNRDISLTTGEDAPVHPMLQMFGGGGHGEPAFKGDWIAHTKKPDGGTPGPQCETQAGKDVPCDPATLAREGYGPHGNSGTMADEKVPKKSGADGGTKMTADGASVDIGNLPDLLNLGSLIGGKGGGLDNLGLDFKALMDKAGLGGGDGKSTFESFMEQLGKTGFGAGLGEGGLDSLGDMMSLFEAFGGTDDDSLFKARLDDLGIHKAEMAEAAFLKFVTDASAPDLKLVADINFADWYVFG